jgi:ribosomal protein S18 acetylase RimI-like enzyme
VSPVRRAGVDDAAEVARLLHDFNTEFSDPSPGVEVLADRGRQLLADGEITVLLGGEGPDGVAMIRFRPSIWTGTLDAYLEELYVAPEQRGRGIGRALLEMAMETARKAGASHMDLGTSESDTAARSLYESCGFSNHEGRADGPRELFYERDL